jgi:hypothetical protein
MKTKSRMWGRAETVGPSSEKVDFKKYSEAWSVHRSRRSRAFDAPLSDGRQVREAKRVFFHRAPRLRFVARESAFIAAADIWGYLRSAEYPVEIRSRLLAELIGRGEDVSDFIFDELSRAENDHLWRNELIFAAEHADFRGDARILMATMLLGYAKSLLGSAKADTVAAIWSALRRYTSLVGGEGISALTDFLSPAHAIGTKQVVLQSIQRVFMSGPPIESQRSSLVTLTKRVSELTGKYLDGDWLTPGENSSLAVNALCADAALADDRLVEYCARLASLKIPRMSRMSSRLLQGLLSSWLKSGVKHDSPALSRLRAGHSSLLADK